LNSTNSAKAVKAVLSVQAFHATLEAMTRNISRGLGGTLYSLRALLKPRTESYSALSTSSSHDIPQATPPSWLFVRPADLGLYQPGLYHGIVERIYLGMG
jgi:hypothetical protein